MQNTAVYAPITFEEVVMIMIKEENPPCDYFYGRLKLINPQ